jgi:hypothetical protein
VPEPADLPPAPVAEVDTAVERQPTAEPVEAPAAPQPDVTPAPAVTPVPAELPDVPAADAVAVEATDVTPVAPAEDIAPVPAPASDAADAVTEVPEQPAAAPAGDTPDVIFGQVLRVSPAGVTISIGSNSGVKKGMVLMIYRTIDGKTTMVGNLRVQDVQKTQASGIAEDLTSQPEPGDTVAQL